MIVEDLTQPFHCPGCSVVLVIEQTSESIGFGHALPECTWFRSDEGRRQLGNVARMLTESRKRTN